MIENLIKSIIVNTWTSFETLAGSLLRNVREEHAAHVADVDRSKSLPVQRLESMRASFEAVFKNDIAIQNALNVRCVNANSLLRNLLVHRAGIVDDVFKQQCLDADLPKWAGMNEGDRFPCDGDIVVRLVDPILEAGYSLIRAVDAWLTNNDPAK